MAIGPKYLIWSSEHRGWWKGNRHGYTTATHRAGVFDLETARHIVTNANRGLFPHEPPNEFMVQAPTGLQIDNDLTADLEWPQAERIGRIDQAVVGQLSRSMAINARLSEGLHKIKQWSEAYPLPTFPEPDLEKARQLLEAGGLTLDAISAHCMRHVLVGVGGIAREALQSEADTN